MTELQQKIVQDMTKKGRNFTKQKETRCYSLIEHQVYLLRSSPLPCDPRIHGPADTKTHTKQDSEHILRKTTVIKTKVKAQQNQI